MKIKGLFVIFILFVNLVLMFFTQTPIVAIEQHEATSGTNDGFIDADDVNESLNETTIIRPDDNDSPHSLVDFPIAGPLYEKIDDVIADDDTTYVYSDDDGGWDSATLYFEDISTNAVPLKIEVFFRARITHADNSGSKVFMSISQLGFTYETFVNNTAYQNFLVAEEISYNVSVVNSMTMLLMVYNDEQPYTTRITQLNITIHYSPGFTNYRTIASNEETNNFSFTPSVNYSGDVTFRVPISNSTNYIDDVTNNTCGTLATSVDDYASLTNNTYFYDNEDQYLYIRTINITTSTTVNWTVNSTFGRFAINVFNENTSNEITCWDIYMSNNAGTTTYESTCNNNTLYLTVDDIPYGEDTLIKISCTNYSFRIYYMDFVLGENYTLNAYLVDVNETESYLIRIINEYQNPVVDAKVQVQRYINETLGIEDVSIMLTDGNGYCPAIWLIPNEDYAVRITADGYDVERYDFFPISYVEDRYFTFQIGFTEREYENETVFEESITFNGYIDGTTMYVNYSDGLSETVDTTITIWEYNTSNTTNPTLLTEQDVRSGDHNFQLIETVEGTNCYEITLDLNHTTFGYTHLSFTVCNRATITTKTTFDTMFDNNFKFNPFGWSNTFGLFLLIATLFSFGQRNSGVGLLLCGFILLGINSVIGLALITISIPVIFICLGILVQWNNQRREYG